MKATARRPRPSGAPALALFDLDGTLLDTVPDLADAVDAALIGLGLPAAGPAAVRGWVGDGVERLVERALEVHGARARRDEALAAFMRHYDRASGALATCFPGVREGLEQVRGAGSRLACITNKPTRFTAPLLERFALDGYFELLVCGDTLARRKPHPLPLRHAMQRLDATPARTVLVGDSDNDVRAARAAGVAVIGVSYGYNRGRDIRGSAPDAVVDSLEEVAAAWRRIAAGPGPPPDRGQGSAGRRA